jgi:hypothetical protein
VLTLNNIVQRISDFADAHEQINTFFFLTLPDNEKDLEGAYPMLFCEPVSSEVAKNYDSFTLQFMIVNQPIRDNRNSIQEVLSDTKLIANDVIAYLAYQISEMVLTDVVGMEHIVDAGDDSVTGWRFSVNFKLNQGLDSCNIPATSTPDNTYGQVLILNQDGDTIATLNAGQTYTVEQLQAVIDTIDNNTATIIDPID